MRSFPDTAVTIINPKTGATLEFRLLADFQTTRVTTSTGYGDFSREFAAEHLTRLLNSGWTRVKAA